MPVHIIRALPQSLDDTDDWRGWEVRGGLRMVSGLVSRVYLYVDCTARRSAMGLGL